ncbi:MAG: NAD(+) diphosphatase [Alphaproteobacteria bacterium]
MRRLSNPPPHVYANRAFDRAAKARMDAAWLERERQAPGTRVLLMSGLKVMVLDEADPPCALWLTVSDLQDLGEGVPEEALFLGRTGEASAFAIDLGARQALPGARFVELRSVGGLLPAEEAGLLAYSRGLLFWHQRHRFCGACGGETHSEQGGHVRKCSQCGTHHFPRSDPAVIVLVTHRGPLGERCLLGRSPRFVPGMYSTLAGFVEPGESLEETVAREIHEESGIQVTDITYRSSQPWPFPASLMLGFHARALDDHLMVDRNELEDARWFTREELLDPTRRPIRLPNPDSIARHLIEDWLVGTAGPPA